MGAKIPVTSATSPTWESAEHSSRIELGAGALGDDVRVGDHPAGCVDCDVLRVVAFAGQRFRPVYAVAEFELTCTMSGMAAGFGGRRDDP